ncbi:MAG TPA: amidohydrolase family protein [Candidatus Hydrogenedentes bacterium]|nr:amidohydrolase family protein [Candidatus Hydrogenedentota bacterium]HPG66776.1 amidohydrolase family protein [Candidatus Hydrogenedentota bacterium]
MTKSSKDLHERLQRVVDTIAMVDTHEHIPPEETVCGRESSFFDFFEHYVSSDLVSAGMSRESLERMRNRTNGLSLDERWALMAPYWPYARTTGYGRAMLEYMHDLFGIDDVNEHTYREISARIREAHQPGWYRHVLKDKANIDTALTITWPGQSVVVDRDLFRAVPILDHYAMASTRAELEALEAESDCAIQTLDQLLAALETQLDAFVEQGIAAVKIFLAYRRTLRFEAAARATAARCFDRIWLSQVQDLRFEDMKPLQDFVIRHLIGLATDRGLPIQIHTGLQEGNGNYLENSKPTLLTNLFMEFGDTRFDVFHAGYPYVGEVTALAKNFPNVCADLCWIHAISPTVAEQTLDQWLETIPLNKILGFGGDSNYVEGAYGHGKIARRSTVHVLAQKVEAGYLTEEEASWVARRILRENALEFFALDAR